MTPTKSAVLFALPLALAACQTGRVADPEAPPQKPFNVILMMADDLASNDLSCYGGRHIQTPRIDRMAAEGLRLTDYYAGSAVCSPSRMALLAGAYPARLGWRRGVLGYGFEPGTGMSPAVYTVAEAFRDAGYRTAMAGKWHLGAGAMQPERQGFDSALYIRMSNNQNRDMYRDGELVAADWDNRLLTETFAEEAIRVIESEQEKPFFLYLPWSAPHFPAEPHPAWAGRSGEDRTAPYRDVVAELDARIGDVMDALERSGRADSTIVVFTSDNGRQSGQETAPPDPLYSGRKWQSLEGGTRVPCIVWCPGVVQPGRSDMLMAAIDLFPSLAGACGVRVAPPAGAQRLDGLDLWSRLADAGSSNGAERSELLYWHGQGAATAIRSGPWKLRFHSSEEKPLDPPLAHGPELFDLRADPREEVDRAAEYPAIVQRLAERARDLLEDVYGAQVPLGCEPGAEAPSAPVQAVDVWGPWLEATAVPRAGGI